MSIKPIIPSIDSNNSVKNNNRIKNTPNHNRGNVSFQGGTNPIVTIMDAVDRGGFAGAFVLQDFLGMAAPRVGTGVLRNHDKTGEYNWHFARREGIREILSGPSAFLIPMAILPFFKKFSGASNDVPIDFINRFSETFETFAKNNKDLTNSAEFHKAFYNDIFKNILSSSTEGNLNGEELKKTAKSFSERLFEIHDPNSTLDKKVKKENLGKLLDEFVDIRKQYVGLDVDAYTALYKTSKGETASSLKSVTNHMKNYTEDVFSAVEKAAKDSKDFNIEEFVQKLAKRRSGSRLLTNLTLFSAVVGFYTIIPKLYNMGIKGSRDPGLDGLDIAENKVPSKNPTFGKPEEKDTKIAKLQKDKTSFKGQPAFTGAGTKVLETIGEKVRKPSLFKSIADKFEFDGASMGPMAMLTLLFGFCLPPRLYNAKSSYERKEIIVRDLTSFAAILFAGKALARGFAKALSAKSGLVLSKNPEHHETLFQKFKNYFSATGGVKVFDSPSIISKYSGLRNAKNGEGINNFIEFIESNGGNINKVLANIDEDVAKASEKIIGKPIKDASKEEIINAFKNAKTTHPEELETIYKAFDAKDNKFVTKAKTYNSSFGLISNLVLVPLLMIGLANYCEKMTARAVAEANKKKKQDPAHANTNYYSAPSNKPTMAGFLGKKVQ